MPPKAKKPAAAAAANSKASSPAPESKPAASKESTPAHDDTDKTTGIGKPDKAAYDGEQESIKREIEAVQTKLVRTLLVMV